MSTKRNLENTKVYEMLQQGQTCYTKENTLRATLIFVKKHRLTQQLKNKKMENGYIERV